MARKSGRVRASKAVYTEDPFAVAGISDDEPDENPPKRARRLKQESPSDDEFVGGEDEEEEEVDDDDVDDEEMEDAAASEEAEDEEEGEAGEAEEDGRRSPDETVVNVNAAAFIPKKKAAISTARPRTKAPDGSMEMDPNETHYRGGLNHNHNTSKEMLYRFAFGSDERDLFAALYQRDQWLEGGDACLPRRNTLENPKRQPDYPYGPTLGLSPEDFEAESKSAWDWYYDKDIGDRFRATQHFEKLKKTDINKYLAKPPTKKHTVLMGPADQQTQIDLGYDEPYDYSKPWDFTSGSNNQKPRKSTREGWLMSFGRKIQCLAWAPNQEGLSQYLVVVVPITEAQKKKCSFLGADSGNSFQPTPSYPCALQLWEFRGKEIGCPTKSLDMSTKPQRRLVACTNWGDIRSIAWCPMPREERHEDSEGDTQSIGLLAGIWGDGKVRVLDIKVHRVSQQEEYVRITSPVFEARPPSTVCSCVTWLSPSDIAVGCSDGHVAAWSILPPSSPEPHPFFYRLIHSTWVLSITSAYPSNPHLISTISMDGETQLWSMIEPQGEITSTVRMRMAARHVSYSPVLQSVISIDENDFGRMMPIRRFFSSTAVANLPSSVISLAPCSFWHPCILQGGTGGEVTATNPFRKLLHTKPEHWQQYWFTHEWVAEPDADGSGTSRFFDGYKAEENQLAKNLASRTRHIADCSITSIYEEGTHVTALGWNPNRRCAAWACAALGCGLLRVEDLAIS
ncbi:hypothetical protein N7481_004327 [Penicillium waksmanii]|uniref:uncharacterized protein n=1 Tax=Penicillium waksmanii TaxID=69791 RepID=UPI0025475BF2|nr:uncharacterized protein N7481_004327 [Penicillium waksmanii]KAJ5989117.1 hypothetical protein N7481_004327 [Penicillium waksmanii]